MEFEYTAFNKEGQRIKSFMKADSAEAVANALRKDDCKPIKILALKKKQTASMFFSSKTVKSKELIIFTRQLGSILSAGVLLSEAIYTIATDMENEYFANILKSVLYHINAGETFSSALSHYPAIFNPYYVAIIQSGEAIGNLGSTITSLASYMEENEKMRLKFIGAIRYPLFLISFVFLIVSGIVLFLIPKFKAIFSGNGQKLPALTQFVVNISEFSLHNFVWIGLCVVLLIFGTWKALQNFRIRFMVDYQLLQFPLIGKVLRKAFIARFCQTFSMLLEGGVGIITALSLSTKAINNSFLKHLIEDVRHNVTTGASLSEAMGVHEDIPRILVKMIAVGEKSGKLNNMIKRMGTYYDEEVEIFLNNINTILEPVFIIIIGAVVLVVALALYLPIFQMSSSAH